ncbi:hypothetical protein C9I98_08265 [Photobacterium sanctipauli]|uniref:Arylamine N-acetyltransferase n=1 Tax=Photobacterium sanctipauli TaxID=1342794 RepID=A0A2T3NX80_9GAMM|nr:arylamine N-acetyltransferase [Photobacterium sanctipauli]PSW20822.1 hypothetical protein C9I98_08265 [Photobacterium sanctipauli]
MNTQAFFERIGYEGDATPSLAALATLQKQFLLAVPFENLYIRRKLPLDLSPEGVFDKIINNQRGGVCFESNALFHDLLVDLGFTVQFIGAEMNTGEPFAGKRNHMALIVTIDGARYLADVGNGRDYGEPIPVDAVAVTEGEDTQYKVDDFEDIKALYMLGEEGKWVPRYIFADVPWQREDFAGASHYVQTSPDSWFTQKTLVSMRKPDGRMTLTDDALITTVGADKREEAINEQAIPSLLRELFGLDE